MEENFEDFLSSYPLALPISGFPLALWRADKNVEITWVTIYLN